MNNINNDYDTIEFGDAIKMLLPKNMNNNEIYEAIEAAIPVLMYGCVSSLAEGMDNNEKNEFINHWSKSSKNKMIKDTMMVVLSETLKIHKFKSNNVKCNNMFNKFCNETFGYFKKNFNNYLDLFKQEFAA